MNPDTPLTKRHLEIAAEAARHWPVTVSGVANIVHINGAGVLPHLYDEQHRWRDWFEGHGGVPVPLEVPG